MAQLNGTDYDDLISGTSANDTLMVEKVTTLLTAEAGDDAMSGGAGDDTYIVDSSSDTITEISGEGTDLIWSSASTFTISENVENLYLKGSSNINATGNNAANVIRGNSGENNLDGRDGDDQLFGNAGNDTLSGGEGNDTLEWWRWR